MRCARVDDLVPDGDYVECSLRVRATRAGGSRTPEMLHRGAAAGKITVMDLYEARYRLCTGERGNWLRRSCHFSLTPTTTQILAAKNSADKSCKYNRAVEKDMEQLKRRGPSMGKSGGQGKYGENGKREKQQRRV